MKLSDHRKCVVGIDQRQSGRCRESLLFCWSVWLILALLFTHTSVFSQLPALSFASVAPENLSNSYVRCFYKDNRGYLWIGTADGLMRYDGTHIFRYDHNPEQKNSLCHNHINAITEDSEHRLWIGTAQGVCMYNRDKDNFLTLDSIPGLKNHLNNRYVTALAFDQRGQVWIGTHEGGVNVFDPAARKFTYCTDVKKGEASRMNYINTLLYADGQMWCGSKGGLRVFDTNDGRIVPITFQQGVFPHHDVSQLIADGAGNIWLATVNGAILKIIPRNGYYTFQQMVSGEHFSGSGWASLLTLCRDTRGGLWFAGENSGLNHLDTKTGTVTRHLADEHGVGNLPSNSIRSVYVDDTGLTWVGTFSKGAYLIDTRTNKFARHKRYRGINDNFYGRQVRAFAEDADGHIWIAADGIGVSKIDSKTGVLAQVDAINSQLANKFLTSMICDRRGNLWLGSAGGGVYKVDRDTHVIARYTLHSAGFGDDKIYCLYEDKRGTIWAGTSGSGLFYFDPETERFAVLRDTLKPDHVKQTAYVTALAEDSKGVLWVATMYGLYALTKSENNTFNYRVYLPGEQRGTMSSCGIQSVYEDKSRNLWVGTTDNGLNRKTENNSLFQGFHKKEGLASNTVRSLISDAAGNLWIAGNMGLSMYNPGTGSFRVYTRDDGLPSNNFNSNACLRSSTGELFFGCNNGFTVFYPDSISGSAVRPKVYLADFKINNQSVGVGAPGSPLERHISLTTALDLSYEQRSFSIDFAVLHLGDMFKPRYCYKLEGFDRDWNCGAAGNSATYTNIDPGTYVFLVKASDGEGGWSETPTRLEITIRPLVWKTWWAMALYGTVIGLVAYLLIAGRHERVAIKHQLALERLARQQEHELIESKTQFFTNISHEFRTPLSLILMPLESLMAEEQVSPQAKDRIVSAYRSADRMMKLVNELMDFNKIESGNLKLDLHYGEVVSCVRNIASEFDDLAIKRGIQFVIKEEVLSLMGWFDSGKLEKILVNVLSNAFKFTPDGGNVTIIINKRTQRVGPRNLLSHCLELVVIDNGLGIAKEEIPRIFDKFYQASSALKVPNPGTGIGLSWTRSLIELHRGFIQAESVPGNETRFTMVIPVDANVFEIENIPDKAADIVYPVAAEAVRDGEAADAAVAAGDRADILVVEDNDALRNYLVRELKPHFNVIEADDGVKALALALSEIPDLIVSDILMPNKTGIELCQAVKADVKTSHIPFILLTAKATLDEQIAGIETGADLYVTKPFSIRYLMTHIRHLTQSRRQLYARFSQDVYLLPENCASNKIDQAFLERVVGHILAHLQDSQLTVDSLAEVVNLSRVQVYRKIKALTGKTAVEFIRSVRLKHTLKLMETRQYTLSEIAYQSGFNSASYFTRAFKDEYGKAPSEYMDIPE